MAEKEKPCSDLAAERFDFWLGEWELTWADGGHGRNRIEKIMDGCVIQENFDGTPSTPLRGMSVSTYLPASGEWKQTWVDNQGGYLDFSGGFADGKMILERDAVIEGQPIRQRMVWYNIQPDALEWNWERSDDDGQTWKTLWHIDYKRVGT